MHPFLSRIRRLYPPALVFVSASVATIACLQALNAPFMSDDIVYITSNARLAELRLTELWRLLTGPYNDTSEFLPLRDLSYWIDIKLFGLTPSRFRLHNILLYLLCLPFIYGVTLKILQYFRPEDVASAPWTAAVVTSLFALHPAHAEAVVWIAGRKDVLSGLFSLLALWLALKARRLEGLSVPYAAATLIVLLAAMCSKASAVALAAVIALLWAMFWHDAPSESRRRSTLLWALAGLLLAVCVALIFAKTVTYRIPFYFGIETVIRALAVLGWLVRLSVSPESHHFFYPVLDDTWLPIMVVVGVAALVTAGWCAAILLRKRSLEGFAVVVFLLLCMPSLQLVPYKPPSIVSDRFLFLAVWMAILLLVVLSWRLSRVPRTVLLLVIAMAWCFQITVRSRDWQSFESIIDTDLRAYPGYYLPAAYKIIGIQLPQGLYREANDTASNITAPEFKNIMVELVKADHAINADAVLTGKSYDAMAILLNLDLVMKHPPVQSQWNPPAQVAWDKCQVRHIRQWVSLARQFPDDVLVRFNAGLYLSDFGYYRDALTHLRAAIESQRLPESLRGAAFKHFGLAMMGLGYFDKAEAPLRAALAQSPPDLRAYCQLSEVYKHTNRFEQMMRAEAECRKQAPGEGLSP